MAHANSHRWTTLLASTGLAAALFVAGCEDKPEQPAPTTPPAPSTTTPDTTPETEQPEAETPYQSPQSNAAYETQGRTGQPGAASRERVNADQPDTAAEVAAQGRAVQVSAANMAFEPKEIRARAGEKLTITLVNNGDAEHNIEFELPDREAMLEQNVQPGGSAKLMLTAPDQAGEYTFYCPVSDHKDQGMTGKLIVTSAQAQPGDLNAQPEPAPAPGENIRPIEETDDSTLDAPPAGATP